MVGRRLAPAPGEVVQRFSLVGVDSAPVTPGAVRTGWAEASKALAAAEDDALVWPEFANIDDENLDW